jgi:hypothetical protein
MSNRSRDAGLGVAQTYMCEPTAHTLAIVAFINRLVKKDGSLAGGRACLASVQAATRLGSRALRAALTRDSAQVVGRHIAVAGSTDAVGDKCRQPIP